PQLDRVLRLGKVDRRAAAALDADAALVNDRAQAVADLDRAGDLRLVGNFRAAAVDVDLAHGRWAGLRVGRRTIHRPAVARRIAGAAARSGRQRAPQHDRPVHAPSIAFRRRPVTPFPQLGLSTPEEAMARVTSIETGLTRWLSKPAAIARFLSASCP